MVKMSFLGDFSAFLLICLTFGLILAGLTIWLYRKAKYLSAIFCSMAAVFSVFSMPAMPIFISAFCFTWAVNDRQNLDFIMSVDASDGGGAYALYEHLSGFSDLNWTVYFIPPEMNVDALEGQAPNYYGADLNLGPDEDYGVLWNWSEGGEFVNDPEIEILDSRYLVMRRGGLLHGIYDIEAKQAIFNESSPWHVYEYGKTAEEEWARNPTTEGYDTFEEWYRVEVHECMEQFLTDPDNHSGLCGESHQGNSFWVTEE